MDRLSLLAVFSLPLLVCAPPLQAQAASRQSPSVQVRPTSAATRGAYEAPGPVPTASLLPAFLLSGPEYRLEEVTIANGLDNEYTLHSVYGTFTARGNGQLARRIAEVRAIAALERMSNTSEFADSLRSTGKEKIEDIKGVVRDPVGTVRAIPKGLRKFGKRAREAVSGERDPHEASRIDQALSVDKARRQIAASLHVDPESDNPVLREQLNRVAWVRAMAGLGLNIASAQLAPAQIAMGLTVVNVSGTLQDAALTRTPGEAREATLAAMQRLGISRSVARRFLDNKAFTTLQLAGIIDKLAAVGPNPTMDVFIDWMNSASTSADAAFMDGTASLVAAYAQRSAPVARFFRAGQMLAFEDGRGNAVLPAFRDYIIWTQSNAAYANSVRSLRATGKSGKGPVIVLVSGLVSPMTIRQAEARGVKLVWNIANQPSQLGSLR